MEQLLALLDTYRWPRHLACWCLRAFFVTWRLNAQSAALRAERTETLGTMPSLKRLRSP